VLIGAYDDAPELTNRCESVDVCLILTPWYSAGGSVDSIGAGNCSDEWFCYGFEYLIFPPDNDYPGTGVDTTLSATSVYAHWVPAAVPIPTAVWLFGSALAGLGWMRRKQTI
jgi:hypothetical protein